MSSTKVNEIKKISLIMTVTTRNESLRDRGKNGYVIITTYTKGSEKMRRQENMGIKVPIIRVTCLLMGL